MKKEFLTIFALMFGGAGLFAQETLDSLKQIQLEAVVVSATRVGKDAPTAYSNLNKADIRNDNVAKNVPYLLQTLPSVVSYSEGGTGIGNTSFRIRGTDANRINVTLNGMPLNNPESQEVFWVNLPDLSNSLESIQIQRGVGTATNGSAAFGGSISMQTTGSRSKPYGEASTAIGSYNAFTSTIAAGTGIMKNGLSIDGHYSRTTGDGYIRNGKVDHKNAYISLSHFTDRQLIKAIYIRGIQHTGITWEGISPEQMAEDRRHNISGEYTDEAGNTLYYDNETDNYYSDIAQLIYSLQLSNRLTLNANFGYNHGYGYYENYKEDSKFSKFGLPAQIIKEVTYEKSDMVRRKALSNDFYSGNFSLNYNADKYSLSGGAMYSYFDGDHYGYLPWIKWNENVAKDYEWYRDNASKRDMNIFVRGEYRPINNLTLYGELQERYVDYRMKGIDDDMVDITKNYYYNFFNPKVGVSYQLNQSSNIYASFGISNREPLRADMKDYKRLNRSIKPERLFDYELGYRFASSDFSFEANLYYMDYKDQLVQTGKLNDVGYKLQENVPDSYRMGVELSLAYTPAKWIRIDANTTLSRNKIKNYTSYYNIYDNPKNYGYIDSKEEFFKSTNISFSPTVVGSGIVTFLPMKDLSFSLINKYVGSMYFNNRSDKDFRLDPYFVANLMAQYTFSYEKIGAIDLRFYLNNYLNNKYVANAWADDSKFADGSKVMGLFPQATCNVMAQVGIRF